MLSAVWHRKSKQQPQMRELDTTQSGIDVNDKVTQEGGGLTPGPPRDRCDNLTRGRLADGDARGGAHPGPAGKG